MEMDVVNASNVAELGEALHIVVDVAFCGRVGGCGTESTGTSDAADDGKMSWVVGVLFKIMKGGINHLCETYYVGGNGRHLLVGVEGGILVTDARTMEIEIHAAGLANEGKETSRCILLGDIDTLSSNYVEVLALNLLQSFLPTSSDAYLPTLGGEHLDQLESYTRGGANDDSSFLCLVLPNRSLTHCLSFICGCKDVILQILMRRFGGYLYIY